MRVRVEVRDGFVVLLAALWCMDGTNVLPLFLLAAAVHEAGHVLTLYLSGGRVHRLVLTCCGAVLRCALPEGRCARAAVCLAGPAASFALTAAAGALGAWRLAGASALLGLFNLLPMPPLDGGMTLFHLCGGRFPSVRHGAALQVFKPYFCMLLFVGCRLVKNGANLLVAFLACGRGKKSIFVARLGLA